MEKSPTKLNESTGKKYTTDQLRNKFSSLRARHREFKNLLAETGIVYSSLTGQVIASDENWKRYYKVILEKENPLLIQTMNKKAIRMKPIVVLTMVL